MRPSRKTLFLLSFFTLIVFGLLGLLSLHFLQDVSPAELLQGGKPFWHQIGWGLSYGVGAALLALAFVQSPWLSPSNAFLTDLIKTINPSIPEILFYSLCAGIGEELLFRAGIQPLFNNPLAGIWVTSIIFIALHGYISFTHLELTLYGILMILVSAGIGYLLLSWGIYACIAAHFIFDVIMFAYLKWAPQVETEEE